jgi:hypothetical protein
LSFTGLDYGAYATASNVSSVLLTSKIILYGFCNSTSGAIAGVSSLLASSVPAVSTDYWTITMTVKGSGSTSSDTYTIYYYGI